MHETEGKLLRTQYSFLVFYFFLFCVLIHSFVCEKQFFAEGEYSLL